ncbi:MAG: AMP-binding protein [Treponema sp.]|nr:AMP-binding protein [Treponema sp.]MCL2272181.1 AMP-binding protein [Treponema sp.]
MKYLNEETLSLLCLAASHKYHNRPSLSMLTGGVITKSFTYAQMGKRSVQAGLLLKNIGINSGDRVLLLSENNPEWGIFYFGIAHAGAVCVPLLTGFPEEQIAHIARHAGVSAVCLSRSMAEKIDKLPQLPFIYIDTITDSEEITVSVCGNEKQMQLCLPEQNIIFPRRSGNDLAVIIYTSGTSGSSKGVMLSNTNLLSCALAALKFAVMTNHDRLLSVLPLAHSYECTLGFIAPMIAGSQITYIDKPPSPTALLSAVKAVRPTIMATVPLLIEKIYRNGIAPKLKKNKLFKFPLTRPLAIIAAGRKLISVLGGRIRFYGIGGAPLSEEVEKFLRRARFPYAIGYGLTETAPLLAGSKPNRFPVRSTGVPTKGVTIRIANIAANGEGEIQVKGPNIMMGYYNDKEKTDEVFTSDGWFKTGDLGKFKKRMLFIKGRLKALILGPSGENIYPEEIEGLLGTSSLVEDALVYSGDRGELVALVSLTDAAKAAAGAVENMLEELRFWVNKKLAAFSQLSKIEIKYEPFEKTPTMKIKRYLYV